MSVDVSSTMTIGRPVAVVADYAGDPTNAPAWYANISSVEWQTSPPVAVGSLLTFRASFLGRDLLYTYEVVELVRRRRLVISTAEGPFPMETTYEWEALDEQRTRMTLRNRGEPAGFARLSAPLVAAAMRRANAKDLVLLKKILEGPDPR
ncbi:SRPBCC family protein [Actinotalea sp. Marseille-Q4924]|uniref:SRPBCC family protein n=1 Tax=Actinotalea sp. Marseille-Q4924 TaxID=2866571 RepID=UPI001CE469B8|nr:SRPBCC family protein [Actinotalea sp. Marseille-Q4924]